MVFFNDRYKESKVALEAAVDCLKFSALEDGKKKKFLKDVQDSMHKVKKHSRDKHSLHKINTVYTR